MRRGICLDLLGGSRRHHRVALGYACLAGDEVGVAVQDGEGTGRPCVDSRVLAADPRPCEFGALRFVDGAHAEGGALVIGQVGHEEVNERRDGDGLSESSADVDGDE